MALSTLFMAAQFWFSFNFFSTTVAPASLILADCEAADCIMLGAAAVLPTAWLVAKQELPRTIPLGTSQLDDYQLIAIGNDE